MATPKYQRVLLKLSGEALMGDGQYGICPDIVRGIAADIADVVKAGVQLSVVVGGGNIFRGVSGASQGMDRATADYMGMLATSINALALQNALEQAGIVTRVQSAVTMNNICEPYIRRRALRHMEKGRVVVFAAGTGNPFFTTDTAAALRASEMQAEVLMKATKVDGIYSADPKKDPTAVRYDTLTYLDVLARDLKVMDAAAISLARENHIPVIVFNLKNSGSIFRTLCGEEPCTVVTE